MLGKDGEISVQAVGDSDMMSECEFDVGSAAGNGPAS